MPQHEYAWTSPVCSLPRPCTRCSWTILHKVLTRLNDFDGAVSTLCEALRVEQITPNAAGSTITASLRYDLFDGAGLNDT